MAVLVKRIRARPATSAGVCGVCLAATAAGIWFLARGAGVVQATQTKVFRAADGTLMVEWTCQDGSRQSSPHPMPEHADTILKEEVESVWYHPSAPRDVVYYGRVWPVPYVGIILLVLTLPPLVAFLWANTKR